MFPQEIINIIIKYQNFHEVEDINKSINKVVKCLKQINNNISEQLYMLMDGINVDSSEQQLLDDSRTLRNYISNIKLISHMGTSALTSEDNKSQNDIKFSEQIMVNIVDDTICHECNVHLKGHKIDYKTEYGNDHIWWYQCPCCKKLYCVENEIEDFDFSATNIVPNYICDSENVNINLNFTDVIVLSTINSCTCKEHTLSDVITNIPTFKSDGSIEFISMNISYCNQCNKYIMLKNDFKEIENIIACQVIDKTITRDKTNSDEIEIKQYESVLYRYGYNVKTKESLSSKQRHLILASVVESNILTRQQICSHLDTLIERGSKISKWKEATIKWKQDREYVKKYNSQNLPEVLVKKVIAKYSQISLF